MAVNNAPGPVPGPNVGPGGPGGPVPTGSGSAPIITSSAQRLDAIDEQVWLQLGSLAESMGEYDRAMAAYESALRHNYHSVSAMNLIAELYRSRENFPKAAEYFQRILTIDNASGEVWGSLGHCFLMMDELQKAYNAYQNALHHLPNPKDSKLWYGIGILYDRYGSVEHAEEAFSAVMRMDPKYEKANEIYFRLGIIYKGQQKYSQSLECFRYILHTPPRPLTEADIWFQIGHVHEQQKEYTSAKEAYERVLTENPNHAKVLQQLGWLYHQQNAAFMNQDLAIKFLTRSIESDNTDAQSWYLMGRCYMAQQKYNKAYEAYQQAVYRDSKNPTFWCSIGLLYFQINQYRDALDAYSKAIRINPNISEVWYDLGTLYESCNNQVSDAIDAYQRASDLDPDNQHIKQRLAFLRQNNGAPGGVPPPPEEMNPNAYPPAGGAGGQHFGQSASMNGEHPHSGRDLPLPGNGSGQVNSGQASGSPGYMGEDRQPHIPGINSGGPRPPTPAGAMPQMMSGDRMQGPPQMPPSLGPGHPRPPRRQSPAPEGQGPYARPGSPGLAHSSNGHGHDPHYAQQHPYGHGPPPAHNMMHGGPPQGYDRQDQGGPRPKPEQHPQYQQHHRQRSGDISRPGPMDDGHGGPPTQRLHPSDPHAHASSPPRDDRRPPPPGPGGYNQQPMPGHHGPDERWPSPSGLHGRHPSDDQGRDGGRPPSGNDRIQGGPRNSSAPDNFPGRNDGPQQSPHGLDAERREQRPMERHSPSFSRPGSEQAMREGRPHGVGYEDQQQGRGREFESSSGYPEEGRGAPNWPGHEGRGGYQNEDQDQDEIAASLVSLSGKGSSRAVGHRPQDDDYDMEEPEAASSRDDGHASSLSQDQQNPPDHHRSQLQRQPSPVEGQSPHDSRDYNQSSRPPSHPKQQPEEQQEQQQERQVEEGSLEGENEQATHRSSSPHASSGGPTAQVRAPSPRGTDAHEGAMDASTEALKPADTSATKEASEEDAGSPLPAEDTTDTVAASNAAPPGSEEGGRGDQTLQAASTLEAREVGADASTGEEDGALSTRARESVERASAPQAAAADDEDTEMEEGEVREDEDEVMSSGAVPAVSQGSKEESSK
ncbi:hypothetical protein BGZ99_003675 [Dissophora globulifera]|uniref:Uncharacterized protein n=1 Tax=Dissophora globulifera TaxID=979702 RepID=A0A9P6RJM7_9FUNG|nr:hypothetical protein BGZ99_003675 [Dissophora globulifera]